MSSPRPDIDPSTFDTLYDAVDALQTDFFDGVFGYASSVEVDEYVAKVVEQGFWILSAPALRKRLLEKLK
jgi:hypothetical protein